MERLLSRLSVKQQSPSASLGSDFELSSALLEASSSN